MVYQEDLDKERERLNEIRRRGRRVDVEYYEKEIKRRKRFRRVDQFIWVLGLIFSFGFVHTMMDDAFDSEWVTHFVTLIWLLIYCFRVRIPPNDIWIKWGNN